MSQQPEDDSSKKRAAPDPGFIPPPKAPAAKHIAANPADVCSGCGEGQPAGHPWYFSEWLDRNTGTISQVQYCVTCQGAYLKRKLEAFHKQNPGSGGGGSRGSGGSGGNVAILSAGTTSTQ